MGGCAVRCDDDLWVRAEADSQHQSALYSPVGQISVLLPCVLFRALGLVLRRVKLVLEVKPARGTIMALCFSIAASLVEFSCKCGEEGWWDRQGLVL